MRLDFLSLLTAVLFVGLASFQQVPQAQAQIQVADAQVEYVFGKRINFDVSLQSEEPVQQVNVFIQPEGPSERQVVPATVGPGGRVRATYDLDQYPLRVFSHVSYWYQVDFQNGETDKSQIFDFFYEDNRFAWEKLDQGPFHVHWYWGDIAFAQDILNTAEAGLMHIQSILPLPPPETVDIYVYKNSQDMQASLRLSGQNWIAGHADPDLGVIMASLPPGPEQKLEIERQIPHELMHVMLYQSAGNSYTNLPAWFNEGLASISELYPNPDYLALLENAGENSSFLPISALCQVFPTDASSALLAYAESASFTRYLYNQYGSPGLDRLRSEYASGINCDRGAQLALGVPLSRLEFQWQRDTFANKAGSNLLNGLAPWMILFAALLAAPLILIVKGLSDHSSGKINQTSSRTPFDRAPIEH
ncbi:MAG TPA: peptidase MA family metallohydrolase [Anaerolineales bacterium]|nr:peptidase MA family metallohydrolase [Anaerolineales bacterium]